MMNCHIIWKYYIDSFTIHESTTNVFLIGKSVGRDQYSNSIPPIFPKRANSAFHLPGRNGKIIIIFVKIRYPIRIKPASNGNVNKA